MNITPYLLTLSVLIAACADPVGPAEPDVAPATPHALGQVDSDDPVLLSNDIDDPAFVEASKELFGEASRALADALPVVESDASFQAKHESVRRALAQELSREARWMATGTLGGAMLRQLLADDGAPAELVAFYTRLLAENGDPNADLLAEGIRRAGPALADAPAVAAMARASAADHLDRRRSCTDCGDGGPALAEASVVGDERIERALGDLARVAGGE